MRIFVILMATFFSHLVMAVEPAPSMVVPYAEGKDYIVLDTPVPVADPGKIEVAEVFSYMCPHCFHFEPILAAWLKNQKPDVALVQVHASWNPLMEPYQRGFYTLQALKLKEKAHAAVFNAYHNDHKELKDAQAWADFLSVYGVNKQTVLTTYDSSAVTKQIKAADQLFRSYQITGTPEIVVEGKYRVSTRLAASQEEMLNVVQYLVNKSRIERAAKK